MCASGLFHLKFQVRGFLYLFAGTLLPRLAMPPSTHRQSQQRTGTHAPRVPLRIDLVAVEINMQGFDISHID